MTEWTKALGRVTARGADSCRVAVGTDMIPAKVLAGVCADIGSRVALLRIGDQWLVAANVVVS